MWKLENKSIKNPYYKHNTHKSMIKGKLYIFIFYSIMYSIIKQNKKWKFICHTPNHIQILPTPRIPSLTIPSPWNLLSSLEFIWLKYIVPRNKIIFWTAISDLIRFMLTHLRLPMFFESKMERDWKNGLCYCSARLLTETTESQWACLLFLSETN